VHAPSGSSTQQVVATVPEMGGADAHDEFKPPHNGGEDPVEPLEIVPHPVPIEGYDPEVGGRSVVDAWTGAVVPRVERRSDAPLHTEAVGTPLWRQF
jgi:hypothetical protein